MSHVNTGQCVSSWQVSQLEGDIHSHGHFIHSGTSSEAGTTSAALDHGIYSTLPSADPWRVLSEHLLTDQAHQ